MLPPQLHRLSSTASEMWPAAGSGFVVAAAVGLKPAVDFDFVEEHAHRQLEDVDAVVSTGPPSAGT